MGGAVRATATCAVGILRLIGTYREGILVVILGWISLCCPQVCPTDLVPGYPLWESLLAVLRAELGAEA